MDLPTLLSDLGQLLREHWPKAIVSLGALVIGTWWGKRRARAEWSRKRFLDRINFSLNLIHDGTLQIRTLAEMNCKQVFLNEVAVERILAAAAKTSADDAILPLPSDERWYMLNAVLNEISERYSAGFLKRDMGLPVRTANYLICLTYENAGDLKTRKIRAMIVRKDLLLNLPADPPRLERPHHAIRFNTLKQLAASYTADPSNFLDVEICL
ncbi:MAG TPA: hypothetical protein VGN72_11160 [Tepidisphaeraceae bacterium]|jgi:hypothetical protein|nr:hypothetical protein [Tepidisphaeraceae bacterium]